ncbi:MAG TPA: LON peptidase substrate-binding domain-containing protein [Steroidobacteraceae bacterium]|nr:LON peptidase substrate-binding domain-containing protein [Steroidobacteraceae bacterium]
MTDSSIIALFPLHTVLFPGGPLPLRIFETRYTDMVRRCMRTQEPFGVVMIQEGDEAGVVATTATVGCTARIVDFHTLHDGLLGISCVGERKFRVLRVWRADDGLNMGEVAWLPVEPELPVPAECERLASTLRRALEELAEHYENVARKFDDAAWIGARIAELLPIELADKQALLELDDPLERLRSLLTVVKE